ncbi:MAG: aminotransferase class V-fold PLP-dependent enzyme [Chloroflexia bacterium]|nr:aminotransferase class V-fold PLP-dependent enzyme [Chloroflexia bacterium]
MTIDLNRARRETPGSEHVLHFNNAGSALMPQPVLDAQIDHLQLEARIGGYESAARARDGVERVYGAAAELIGAKTDEIAIIENATRAWDMAFYSIPFEPGDRILTAMAEYGSNYIAYLQIACKTGAVVEVIPNDEHGQTSVDALKEMIDERVKLISITHVPTNGGLVNPANAIGKVAREAGILYLVDACQSVGQLPVNVDKMGCDMLSTTGRKYLRGPRGTGFLYVREEVLERLEPPFLDMRAATWVDKGHYEIVGNAKRFENWETNYAAKIGLGVAIDYALEWGIENIWERVQSLSERLRGELSSIPGVTLRDLGEVRCGIVTFDVAGRDVAEIKAALEGQNINVTASRPPSTRLDMEARGIAGLVRASVHYYNSEDEVSRFCEVLEGIVA